MKNTTLSRTLLGLALLGTLAAAPTMTRIAHADAPDATPRNFDRDDNNRRDRDERRERGDNDRRDDRRDRSDRRDNVRRDDRRDNNQRDNGRRDRFDRRDNDRRADFGRRGRGDNALGRGGVGRPGGNATTAAQFVGVVSKVKSDSEFDVRIGDQTYNVYLTSPAGRVSVGQTVQLNGERIGNNDIRSARLLQSRR